MVRDDDDRDLGPSIAATLSAREEEWLVRQARRRQAQELAPAGPGGVPVGYNPHEMDSADLLGRVQAALSQGWECVALENGETTDDRAERVAPVLPAVPPSWSRSLLALQARKEVEPEVYFVHWQAVAADSGAPQQCLGLQSVGEWFRGRWLPPDAVATVGSPSGGHLTVTARSISFFCSQPPPDLMPALLQVIQTIQECFVPPVDEPGDGSDPLAAINMLRRHRQNPSRYNSLKYPVKYQALGSVAPVSDLLASNKQAPVRYTCSRAEEAGATVTAPKEQVPCSCSMDTLQTYGCQCGGS